MPAVLELSVVQGPGVATRWNGREWKGHRRAAGGLSLPCLPGQSAVGGTGTEWPVKETGAVFLRAPDASRT